MYGIVISCASHDKTDFIMQSVKWSRNFFGDGQAVKAEIFVGQDLDGFYPNSVHNNTASHILYMTASSSLSLSLSLSSLPLSLSLSLSLSLFLSFSPSPPLPPPGHIGVVFLHQSNVRLLCCHSTWKTVTSAWTGRVWHGFRPDSQAQKRLFQKHLPKNHWPQCPNEPHLVCSQWLLQRFQLLLVVALVQ